MSNGRDIGMMDHLVTVQACTIGVNRQGAKSYSFRDHSKVFAKVEGSDDESVNAGNLAQNRALSVTLYKVAGLDTSWRLIIDGQPYAIESINDESRTSALYTLRVTSINEKS